MNKTQEKNINAVKKLLARFDNSAMDKARATVLEIINDVEENGDQAVKRYNEKFDQYQGELIFDLKKLDTSLISAELKDSLLFAAERIKKFHQEEVAKIADWSYADSLEAKLGVKYQALESAAIYIPGGQAPLISTVLMTAIPAKVAGVKRLVLISPPRGGDASPIDPAILYAAKISGVDEVYCCGGAQSIAAIAYGTETISPVNKVVGPGNIYVSIAKKEVFGKIGIDGIYGPSELAIIADKYASPLNIAADLLSQLEHGSGLESCLLVSDNEALISETRIELEEQIEALEKFKTEKEIAVIKNSLEQNSALLHVKSLEDAIELINLYAPEHLELQLQKPEDYLDQITNAGAIFIGDNSCESFGDYLAGPSHCLPTAASARFSSGLQCSDFIKKTSIIDFRKTDIETDSFKELVKHCANIARAEKLEAHARAAERRV